MVDKSLITAAVDRFLVTAQADALRNGRTAMSPPDDTIRLYRSGYSISDENTVSVDKDDVAADFRPGLIVQALRDIPIHELVFEILICIHSDNERMQFFGMTENNGCYSSTGNSRHG